MTMKLNFHALVEGWHCQAPRHGGAFRPPAVALALFTDAAAIEERRILVHQASYVCRECKDWLEADIR